MFTIWYDARKASIEKQAMDAVGRGLAVSPLLNLHLTDDGLHRGYLVREAERINLAAHNLTAFDLEEVRDFIDIDADQDPQAPKDITRDFLSRALVLLGARTTGR